METYSRITVLAPRVRVDVALPSDVTIADLMPNLLDLTQVSPGDGGAAYGGWCLSRIGEPELDASQSLAAHHVLDGELLHLRPRRDKVPDPVYDEIVDAIAAASAESSRRWDARLGRHLGLTVAGVALALTAVSFARLPSSGAVTQLAVGLAVLLIAAGTLIARSGGDRPTAVLLGCGALPLVVVGALRTAPDSPDSTVFLLASAELLVTSVLANLAIGTGRAVFAGGATVAALSALTFLAAKLVTAPSVAFAAGHLLAATTGLLLVPRFAARFAALPTPFVPTGGVDQALEPDADFPDIIRQTGSAQQYLTGMYGGVAVATGGSAMFLTLFGGFWPRLLAFAGILVLLLRARALTQTPHVLALLLPGLATGIFCLVVLAQSADLDRSLWAPGCGLIVAALAIAVGVVIPRRRFAPPTRRLVDTLEAVLIASLMPLGLAVMNLYRVFRQA